MTRSVPNDKFLIRFKIITFACEMIEDSRQHDVFVIGNLGGRFRLAKSQHSQNTCDQNSYTDLSS